MEKQPDFCYSLIIEETKNKDLHLLIVKQQFTPNFSSFIFELNEQIVNEEKLKSHMKRMSIKELSLCFNQQNFFDILYRKNENNDWNLDLERIKENYQFLIQKESFERYEIVEKKRNRTEWILPGGVREKMQDPLQCIINKTKQECGCIIEDNLQPIAFYDKFDNRNYLKRYYLFQIAFSNQRLKKEEFKISKIGYYKLNFSDKQLYLNSKQGFLKKFSLITPFVKLESLIFEIINPLCFLHLFEICKQKNCKDNHELELNYLKNDRNYSRLIRRTNNWISKNKKICLFEFEFENACQHKDECKLYHRFFVEDLSEEQQNHFFLFKQKKN